MGEVEGCLGVVVVVVESCVGLDSMLAGRFGGGPGVLALARLGLVERGDAAARR